MGKTGKPVHTVLISFLNNSINTRLLAAYLKENGHKATCFFFQEEMHEPSLDGLVRFMGDEGVSLAGISLVTDDYHKARRVTAHIKQKTDIPVIWGGAHVNVRPDECLKHADMICMGEGEEALLDIVSDISSGRGMDHLTRNIWFKTNDGIVRNETREVESNLDKYPFPDFDMNSQYVANKNGFEKLSEEHLKGEYSIMTSRGCPYSCRYCYNNYRRKQYKGKYLRKRSIGNVIEELQIAKRIFKGLMRIKFWDDSFVARKIDDFREFSALYREKVDLPFFALIEPMVFDRSKIQLLKDCGMSALQIGVQTGSERINREIYNRPVANEKILSMADEIKAMDIGAVYDIIFNNPYEKTQDIFETVDLLSRFPRPLAIQGYNLIFYPGTEITEDALRDGYISLKEDIEENSTIESREDSPITMRGKSKISSRFYEINYNPKEKEYANSVLSLLAYSHVPRWLIGFFAMSETPVKRYLLRRFMELYDLAHKMHIFLVGMVYRSRTI